jgi:hypothetical protein
MYIDHDGIQIYALTNYVPAVAVIRKRLVFFILNRFKGYVDGRKCLNKDTSLLEFYVGR